MKPQLSPQKYKSGRKKKSPLTLAKEAADRALQEWGRRNYSKCECCGGKYSCLHHFFRKSISTNLRFDKDNLIPICVKCHYNHHHNDDPIPHATIILKRGEDWYKSLEKKRFQYVKANIGWYNENREKYEKL